LLTYVFGGAEGWEGQISGNIGPGYLKVYLVFWHAACGAQSLLYLGLKAVERIVHNNNNLPVSKKSCQLSLLSSQPARGAARLHWCMLFSQSIC
jgi:hypothetical protein